jgi:DNA invertase Pin-like site-specific DNA recombinase
MKLVPAVSYLRVSTVEQARRNHEPEGYSIPAQREDCQRKAALLEAEITREFVDRGASARSADRPELQAMLAYIDERDVRYVVVHKLDRLARNLADHVQIMLAIKQAGAELVSVTEVIDDTPQGQYMTTIFAANAQLYSANLSTEAKKGLLKKAKLGGTPGLAPIGYLNARKVVEGYEVRDVDVDPDRAPLVQRAFAAYASGAYTLDTLHAAVTRWGLTTRLTRKKSAKPLSRAALAKMLANRYYIGTITFAGIENPNGRHPPLIDTDTFWRVQQVLAAHNRAGEKDRKHHHYLKGTLYCERCGSRLTYTRARGNGGTYWYFVCIGRITGTGCSLPYLPADAVEERVTAYWRRIQLDEERVEELRRLLGTALSGMQRVSKREVARQRRRIDGLKAKRQKLLDAFYSDAIAVEHLKTEQDRITGELANAERQLASAEEGVADVGAVLGQALDLIGECHGAYANSDATARRQWNQAFFKKLRVDAHDIASDEREAPFDDLTDPHFPKRLRGKAPPPKHPSVGRGSKERLRVGAAGFEPATFRPPRRPELDAAGTASQSGQQLRSAPRFHESDATRPRDRRRTRPRDPVRGRRRRPVLESPHDGGGRTRGRVRPVFRALARPPANRVGGRRVLPRVEADGRVRAPSGPVVGADSRPR